MCGKERVKQKEKMAKCGEGGAASLGDVVIVRSHRMAKGFAQRSIQFMVQNTETCKET